MNFRKDTIRSRYRSRRNSLNAILKAQKWRTSARKSEIIKDFEEDDSTDEEHTDTIDWKKEFFGMKEDPVADDTDLDSEVTLSKKQTLILATLVPDEVLHLNKFEGSPAKKIVGVLMLADVSGFTPLSERYYDTGKGGTYRLTATLNGFLGSLTETIYNHGGDIIKFAGDAFLALWAADKRNFLCHTIHQVIACALYIQHAYGVYETDVKINLRLKIALSAGNVYFSPIGKRDDLNYIIVGLPVQEAKAVESQCSSGDVRISGSAWGHCYSRNYNHVVESDGHVIIKNILYDCREKDVLKPFIGFSKQHSGNKAFGAIENLSDFTWGTSESDTEYTKEMMNVIATRGSILQAESRNIGAEIRKFMIKPVLQQVDAHQPLEYLTEMRNVTIMFTKMKVNQSSIIQFITVIDNAYQTVGQIVYKSMGCVNKIILFDKDTMILVVFGLRGFKHESEAQIALKCACTVRKAIKNLDGVSEVSVGVTSGKAYCGVIGHPLRREFTVIGTVVNKAARIMCAFPHSVCCDEQTFISSKLAANSFMLQAPIHLKGIKETGNIYEFNEKIRSKKYFDIETTLPLLNRNDEIEFFRNWIDPNDSSYKESSGLLIIGEARIGKSKLLESMTRIGTQRGLKCTSVILNNIHTSTNYLALNQIVNQILEYGEPHADFYKEEKIVQILNKYSDDLCYLNKILNLRFAYSERIFQEDDTIRTQKALNVFKRFVLNLPEEYLLVIDNIHNIDGCSGEFISVLIKAPQVFPVMSLTRGRYSSLDNWLYDVFMDEKIKKIMLSKLDFYWIPALACQILDTIAIPKSLRNFLKIQTKGNPGAIESLLLHLFSNGTLTTVKYEDLEKNDQSDDDFIFPDPELLRPYAKKEDQQDTLNIHLENDCNNDSYICKIVDESGLTIENDTQDIDVLVMMQIDKLTPYQQLLLKIASVIGTVFSRELLESIMYDNNALTTARAIKRLFALKILACANYRKSLRSRRSVTPTTSVPLVCNCLIYTNDDDNDLPKYAFCKLMKFRSKMSRDTCYELLPTNQKKEFHTRIINFLENKRHLCERCGGQLMFARSLSYYQYSPSFQQEFINLQDKEEDPIRCDEIQINREGKVKKDTDKDEFSSTDSKDDFVVRITKSTPTPSPTVPDITSNASGNFEQSYDSSNRFSSTKFKSEPNVSLLHHHAKRVTVQYSHIDIHLVQSSESVYHQPLLEKFREISEASTKENWKEFNLDSSSEEDELKDVSNSVKPTTNMHHQSKISFGLDIEKGVSEIDFETCSCPEQRIIAYDQLITHATQADLKLKAIDFLITYVELCLTNDDLDSALGKLEDVEERLFSADILKHKEWAFDIQRHLGKFYTLKTLAAIASSNLYLAKSTLDKAIEIYQINFRSVVPRSVIDFTKGFRCVLNSKLLKKKTILSKESLLCLNTATLLYILLNDLKSARTSAYAAVEVAKLPGLKVPEICEALTNAINLELDRERLDATKPIEIAAISIFKALTDPIMARDLRPLGKFFQATFKARIARGDLNASVRAGFRSVTISNHVCAFDVTIELIPDLYYLLLAKRRIPEAIDLVKQLLNIANGHDIESEIWYHALCLDTILDAGFQVEPFENIAKFAQYSLIKGFKGDSRARRRLVVNLWTYYLKVGSDKKSRRWEDEALSWTAMENTDGNLMTLISALRLAEGMLASLSRKVDDLRKVVDVMQMRSLADRELNHMEKDCKLCKTIYSRWLLMRSSSLTLSGRYSAASVTRVQALEEAKKIKNYLEMAAANETGEGTRSWMNNAENSTFPVWHDCIDYTADNWHNFVSRSIQTSSLKARSLQLLSN